MGKTQIEKELKKIQKDQKKASEKLLREQKKRNMIEEITAYVSNRPTIAGFRIADETTETILRNILEIKPQNGFVYYSESVFPEHVRFSTGTEMQKLAAHGFITSHLAYDTGGMLCITPEGKRYFEDKENAYQRENEIKENMNRGVFINYGNFVMGDVNDSLMITDNSITKIEKQIEKNGGVDKEELFQLLDEIKEWLDNIENNKAVPKQKNLFKRLTVMFSKHEWFYGAVVELIGSALLSMLQ